MPGKKAPQNISQAASTRVASTQQIAKLNSLLQAVTEEVRQVNFPLSALLPVTILSYLQQSLTSPHIGTLKRTIAMIFEGIEGICENENCSKFLQLIIVILTFILLINIYSKFTWFANKIVSYFFPNGLLSFNFQPHPAFHLRDNILTEKESEKYIKELTVLLGELKKQTMPIVFLNYAACLVYPLLTNGESNKQLIIRPSELGFFIETNVAGNRTPINSILGLQQAATNTRMLVNLYYYFRSGPNQQNFYRNLRNATYDDTWQMTQEQRSCIYSLTFNDPSNMVNLHIPDQENTQLPVSLYISELFRVFLDYHLKIFTNPENTKLYLIYPESSSVNWKNLKRKLTPRLLYIAEQERNIKENIESLNSINGEEIWDTYSCINNRGQYQLVYYTDNTSIPPLYRNEYLNTLGKIGTVTIEGSVIQLQAFQKKAGMQQLVQDFRTQKNQILRNAPTNVNQRTDVDTFQTVKKRKAGTFASPTEEAARTAPEAPRIIVFSRIHTYSSELYTQANATHSQEIPLANHFVSQLSVPWMPEGRAYAAINPPIFAHVAGHLTQFDLEALLLRGKVEGRNARGGVGTGKAIVACTDAYQNISGTNCTATFKMKFPNNMRIFARELTIVNPNRENRAILYLFDGAGFGH